MFVITESSIRFFMFWGGILFFFLFEISIPYRPGSVSKVARWINNLLLTLFNSLLIYLIFAGAVIETARYVHTNNLGILNLYPLNPGLKIFITVVFMDFMIYVWHLLNHKMPFLWRFHGVHHSDLNMDVSTATRFHLGELFISALIKLSLIFFLGADPTGVIIFESVLVFCAQFHHSSLKVPLWFEKVVWFLFVPPSMHRIHHSIVIKERDSNYGVIFSVWDRLLGTLIRGIDQTRIKIGMGAYQKPEKLYFHQLLFMPFTRAVR